MPISAVVHMEGDHDTLDIGFQTPNSSSETTQSGTSFQI
jgi:hypothetical protein